MTERPRFFYGWVIVGITIISMTLIYGIRHSFSVFFPAILDEFGWSRGSTAFMLSLSLLIYGFVAPVAGSLGDRWKPHRLMPLGLLVLSLATAGSAFARELWHFYLLIGILVPVGTAFCGWPLLAPALANWFIKRRGLATGLGQIGAGLSFTYGMFAELAISQLGWRQAYFVLAGMLALIPLPLYLLLFHYRPEDRGLRAYGAEEPLAAATTRGVTSQDWTMGQALRTRQLWLLMLSYFLFWGIGTYLVLAHQVKFAEDVGYSGTFAASIFALFGILQVGGQLSAGISDRIGREMTVTLTTILTMGALAALVSVKDTSQPWLLYLYAVSFGYGVGFFTPTITAGAADIFHGRHFGAIAGLLLTGMGVGGVIGPWLGGYIHDTTGSYFAAFILSMVCFGLSCTAFWLAGPRKAAKLRAGGS
ncbi:MAG TPA: MFS transporter [Dehalococcoidia bacterium]|nr:MFS transporter [Dehalococcoidia bacterium]